ncbi:MAG: hypothetical protein PHW96_03885 [Candidatus Nanoarchaeia archaeon]|nr:hypothetical protein [Candidatus Nanoarchaeia archaeon]
MKAELYKLPVVKDILGYEQLESIHDPTITTGQSFDEFGEPLDYLKQVLYMVKIKKKLDKLGENATLNFLVADHFQVINNTYNYETSKNLGKKRADFINKILKAFGSGGFVVLSSELKQKMIYSDLLNKLKEEYNKNSSFREKIIGCVPEDKINVKNSYLYPLEELVCIIVSGADIKVGPPYEIHYDAILRELAEENPEFKKIVGIYTTESFPLNCSKNSLSKVGKFGITPYKGNSKGFDPNTQRILMDKHSITDITKIIESTDIDESLEDLTQICLLAESIVEDKDFIEIKLTKKEIVNNLTKYILNPIKNES